MFSLGKKVSVGFGAAALIVASPLVAPQVLAFPYYARAGDSEFWSEKPIDYSQLQKVVARSEALVSASPIAEEREPRRVFLTDGGWRWKWLANTSRGAFAMTRMAGRNIIFNRTDLAADRVYRNGDVGADRQLSSVLAHETTHGMLLDHFGFVAMAMQPRWRVEGYCDHVAQESALSAEEVARIEAEGGWHPALMYYHGRQRVEAELRRNGGDVDALFEHKE